jgi:hypothetical protein
MTRIITAYRTMPLRDGQEARLTGMLWDFGIGRALYRQMADDAEVAESFHSFFDWTEGDDGHIEIQIDFNGDGDKVPELIREFRFYGFVASQAEGAVT